MKLPDFVKLRPFLFHTTQRANLERIRETGRLECAAALEAASEGHQEGALDAQRKSDLVVKIGRHDVTIRDQKQLGDGNIAFEAGWDLPRFLTRLNGLVFFWPGEERGPISHGARHFERYAKQDETLVVLRVPTAELVALGAKPLFCAYNSGSPRHNPKTGASPRGTKTFSHPAFFDWNAGDVVETVVEREALLPPGTRVGERLDGPWVPLR